MGRKIKYEDLEPGMLVDQGLIVSTGMNQKFYGDKPHFKFFEIEDGYGGCYTRQSKPEEEFEILYEKGTEEYKEVIDHLLGDRLKAYYDAEHDVELLRAYKQ